MRPVVFHLLAIAVLAPVAQAEEHASCAFDYVVEEGLIADTFIEATATLPDRPDLADVARRALPNIKRVFAEQGGYIALVGWSKLPEDYSKFSELQLREQFRTLIDYNQRALNPDAEASYRFGETTPFSVFLTLEKLEKGLPYRDVSMDVVATPRCLLSVKFSGRVLQEEAEVWDLFAEELERIRAAVAVEEGLVAFSTEGARFSWYGVLNTIVYLGIALSFAALALVVFRWWFRVEPGKAAWRYSTIVVILAVFNLGLIIYANETWRGVPTLPYESALISLAVLAVHLAVLIVRAATLVLVAISFMIGLFATSGLYTATGWLAVPGGAEFIGFTVGFLLLTYVVWGTLRWKQPDV